MSIIFEQRAKIAHLLKYRHMYPEQGFDLIHLEELNKLKRMEAQELQAKAQRLHAMYLECASELDPE
jgi:hypothetical protein